MLKKGLSLLSKSKAFAFIKCSPIALKFGFAQTTYLDAEILKDSDAWVKLYNNGVKLADLEAFPMTRAYAIADDDKDSQVDFNRDGVIDAWNSHMQKIFFKRVFDDDGSHHYVMTKPAYTYTLWTQSNMKARGAELSNIFEFQGEWLTGCDKTGMKFTIDKEAREGERLQHKFTLLDHDGTDPDSGFKCEWAVVKDGNAIVGSHGRADPKKKFAHIPDRMMWVKVIDSDYNISHVDWSENYDKLYQKVSGGGSLNGYLAHESALWSDIHKRWFFTPRKFSLKKYKKKKYPSMGTNLMVSCDENFENMLIREVLDLVPLHGCSDMAFVPNTGDTEIIFTRTIEDGDYVDSFVAIADLLGNTLLEETRIVTGLKYEGIIAFTA